MNKFERQKFILSLINKKNIKNQKEIVEEFKKNKILVTQATISRDIKNLFLKKKKTDLGLIYKKGNDIYNDIKNLKDKEFLKILYKKLIISINAVDSLIVINTIPGSASNLAFYLDKNVEKDILGTIAGDDTLLIILRKSNLKKKWLKIFKNYCK